MWKKNPKTGELCEYYRIKKMKKIAWAYTNYLEDCLTSGQFRWGLCIKTTYSNSATLHQTLSVNRSFPFPNCSCVVHWAFGLTCVVSRQIILHNQLEEASACCDEQKPEVGIQEGETEKKGKIDANHLSWERKWQRERCTQKDVSASANVIFFDWIKFSNRIRIRACVSACLCN